MGSLCVAPDKEPIEGHIAAANNYDDRIPLTQPPQKSDIDSIDEPNEDESESSENDNDFGLMQFKAMQQEVIILSTRNANLEQQLEEMKKQYTELKQGKLSRQNSQTFDGSVNGLYGQPMVPIAFICEELEIDMSILSESIEVEQLETLLSEIDSKFKFTNEQLKFLESVTDDMDDPLLGLLNILIENNHFEIFYKCIIMEMISFIYHEEDEESENENENEFNQKGNENGYEPKNNNENNNEKIEYEIDFIYEITDQLNIERDLINDIDNMVKQRLGSENKFENLFVENQEQ